MTAKSQPGKGCADRLNGVTLSVLTRRMQAIILPYVLCVKQLPIFCATFAYFLGNMTPTGHVFPSSTTKPRYVADINTAKACRESSVVLGKR